MKSTTDYNMFKMREDNRAKIKPKRVQEMIEKIQKKNLLHLCPIVVNKSGEVINGNHRLLAAKALGVPIFYLETRSDDEADIPALNDQKEWKLEDYLNYYCRNGYVEYQKLDKFVREKEIPLNLAISVTTINIKTTAKTFRDGEYVFEDKLSAVNTELCRATIEVMKVNISHRLRSFMNGAKFWRAMCELFLHPKFDTEKWLRNLRYHAAQMGPRVSTKDYYKMLVKCYNWKNQEKIKGDELDDE